MNSTRSISFIVWNRETYAVWDGAPCRYHRAEVIFELVEMIVRDENKTVLNHLKNHVRVHKTSHRFIAHPIHQAQFSPAFEKKKKKLPEIKLQGGRT